MRKQVKTLFAALFLTLSMGTAAYADEAPRVIIDPSVSGVETESGQTSGTSQTGEIDEAGLKLVLDAQARQQQLNSVDGAVDMDMKMTVDMSELYSQLKEQDPSMATLPAMQDSFTFNINLDMLAKMKNIYDPQNMKFLIDMNMTMPELSSENLNIQMFYEDGWMYMNTMGEKVKQYAPADAGMGSAEMQKAWQELLQKSTYDTSYFKSLTVKEHEADNAEGNTVLSYTMDGNEIMNYVNQIYAAMGINFSELGYNMTISDIWGDMTINRLGYVTADTMHMTMTISEAASGMDMSVEVNAAVKYNNAGQEIDFALPSKEGYTVIDNGVYGRG